MAQDKDKKTYWFGKEVTSKTNPAVAALAGMGSALNLGARNRAASITGSATGGPADQGGTASQPGDRPDVQTDPVDAVVAAGERLDEAGQEDYENLTKTQQENLDMNRATDVATREGQAAVAGKIDEADVAAEEGLEDIQGDIADTRDVVNAMPDDVKTEFDAYGDKLDTAIEEAQTGLEGQRGEALAGVMDGRADAMDAAVSSIHGATQQQIANIDAQVQQGTLSPSQADAMKSRIRMGSSMQLSVAVGQTAHAFAATQAQVATSFGQMFTQMEGTSQQVMGQFGAAAGQAFAAATTAMGQFNVALTDIGAQAVGRRDASRSNNAATRATFNYNSDMANLQMMDYTQDSVVLGTPMAVNSLNWIQDAAGMVISDREFQTSIDLMMKAYEAQKQSGWVGTFLAFVESFIPG
jgi:hypothetical protein